MQKRLISIALFFSLLISNLMPVYANKNIEWDIDKLSREVYVHANSSDPSLDAPSATHIYSGEDVNIYAAIDAPNKGTKNADGTYSESERQYNLNSYVVKFYYDPNYFDIVYHKNATGSNVPINYYLPFQTLGYTVDDAKKLGIQPMTNAEAEGLIEDYTGRVLGASEGTVELYNQTYAMAAGVFVLQSEKTIFPEFEENPNWYNLCNITLRPKAGAQGSTEVLIETGIISNDGKFELIPKHVTGYPYTLKEYTNITNGGYHQLIIGDTAPVNYPIPTNIKPGYHVYPENGDMIVELEADNECEIFYTLDTTVPKFPNDNAYLPYDEDDGIKLYQSSTIRCYARKIINGSPKYSMVVDYQYIIEPPVPTLFFGDGSKVDYYDYLDDNTFTVYATDKSDTFGKISNIHNIYYTFDPTLPTDELKIKDNSFGDPTAEWVKLDKNTQEISIMQTTAVRLVTVRGLTDKDKELSDPAYYMLTIIPEPVTATPSYNPGNTGPFEVVLETVSEGADIYYTTDGSDPKINGIKYDRENNPLIINKNTTIRAAAYLNGAYSKNSWFNYMFDVIPTLSTSAIPYPGEYNEYVDVVLVSGGEDDVIYYTLDGSAPTKDSLVYQKGTKIHIEKDTTIKAFATSKDGTQQGEIAQFKYIIIPDPPVIVPSSTQFNESSNVVSIFKPHTGNKYVLYYTTDGTNPITSSTRIEAADKAEVIVTGSKIIKAVIVNDSSHYSEITTGMYEVVSGRPVRPEVTLEPGIYVYENDRTQPYTTRFYSQPDGVQIYYTISYDGSEPVNPVLGESGIPYDDGDIELKGNTIIKAIAVDENGKKSELGVFYYTIVPEGPEIPESTIVTDITNILLPVKGIEGSEINYTIGDVENTVLLDGFNEFWIDPVTGKAYKDQDKSTELGEPCPSNVTNTSPFELKINATMDGVTGEDSVGIYTYIPSSETILPPYASIPSGTYDEIAVDEDRNGIINDGENVVLKLDLYCLTDGTTIKYYYADEPETIYTYDGTIDIYDDCIIYMYSEKGALRSSENIAFYSFIPLPPVIKPISGMYENKIDVEITHNPLSPFDADYDIFYKKSSEGSTDAVPYLGGKITVDQNDIIKSYTIKNYDPLDKTSGIYSNPVFEYYLFAGSVTTPKGTVYVNSPFDTRNKFAVNELLETPCNQGITLNTTSGYQIMYKYTAKLSSGDTYNVGENKYTGMPIYPSISWTELKITAWLVDENGTLVEGSLTDFPYTFVTLNKPLSTLAEIDSNGSPIQYTKGTSYSLVNEYNNTSRKVKLYYTTNGSDPVDEDNDKRAEYKGEQLKLNEPTTLRAIYMEYCNECEKCNNKLYHQCPYRFYGPEAEYIYSIKTTSSSGGGGGSSGGGGGGGSTTIDKTRKYTVDIFGNEHPTHVGYIYGYPDGSVRPNGNITREEIAAILYRITNHEYEKPFPITGDVFPDVETSRWSVKEIEYMADKDVIYGYPDGEFKPERHLSRAEFAALIFRFTGIEEADIENVFADLDETHWAYDEILALCNTGLVQGYEDGSFRPENYITRAEVMTVINKLLGRKPLDSYVKSLKFNPYNDLYEDDWYYVIVLEATITHNYWLDKSGYEYKWEEWK